MIRTLMEEQRRTAQEQRQATEEQRRTAEALNARVEELARRVDGGGKDREASHGEDEKADDTASSSLPDSKEEQKPATPTTSVEHPTNRGRLDTATLMLFQGYGQDDLECAEDWIAQAEKQARLTNLDHSLLGIAIRQGAVGELKAYLDEFNARTIQDWPTLCDFLHTGFGRDAHRQKCRRELLMLNGITGLSLPAAISRVKQLLAATGHPDTDLGPVKDLIRRFPRELGLRMSGKRSQWKSCQEALDDLQGAEQQDRDWGSGVPLRAGPVNHAPLRTTEVGTVAMVEATPTAEPVEIVDPVAIVKRAPGERRTAGGCYRCGEHGHGYKQCKAKLLSTHSQSKN